MRSSAEHTSPVFIRADLQLKFYTNKDRKAQGKLPPPKRCSTECAEWGLLSFAKASPNAQELCFYQKRKGSVLLRAGLAAGCVCGTSEPQELGGLPALPPAEVEEGALWLRKGRGMKVGKWLGALHSSHLQVAAILAQENTPSLESSAFVQQPQMQISHTCVPG